MSVKEEFIQIFRENIHREGAESLLAWLETTDFFTAPASTRFHLCRPGGLAEHSIHVFYRLAALCARENQGASTGETPAICGLLHDLCKVNFYRQEKKSRKTGKLLPSGKPEWEDYMGYAVDDQIPYGHGEKSVYIISGFMRLTREEAMAIRWHMGGFDDSVKGGSFAMSGAFGKYPLAVMTHIADLQATYLDENEEEQK